ncbi:MAG: DNA-binding NtrC family response regulator [Candidatus Azotimanducaceae bacterium]|jgi:two-component system response regulator HydG
MRQRSILIIEDEVVIRTSLKKYLGKQGFSITEAGSVEEADATQLDKFDLIITDLRLPGPPGTDIIARANPTPVLVMTSYASVTSAVDAMKLGAVDYIAKPFEYKSMLSTINSIIGKDRPSMPKMEGMLGHCDAMQVVFERITKVAPTDTNVLILGESGTGKELVAKAIHTASKQSSAPIISVNCAAIPDTLIESELFGHEKGAFTGATNRRLGLVEAANGGTLFLDEIGELPLDAQARLLRVLQEGEIRRVGSVETTRVKVRLIAATHRDLKALTATGQFREDLYYRLNVVKLSLPPLREREGDIEALAKHFLSKTCEKMEKPCLSFDPKTLSLMSSYRWPGNIRELENSIERAVILTESKIITPDLLAIDFEHVQKTDDVNDAETEDLSLEDYFQKFVIENQDHMTETELAHKLGISRKALWQKRQKLQIPRIRSKRR